MSLLLLSIMTPTSKVYEDRVQQVTVSTQLGQITVLPHHMQLCANLIAGVIVIKKEKEEIRLICSDGFLTVSQNEMHILAERVEYISDIKIQDIHDARIRTEHLVEKLQKYEKDDTIKKRLKQQLDFEQKRLQVQEMYEKE